MTTDPTTLSDLPEDDPAVEADEQDVEHFQWRVTKNLTRRIDQYLVDRVGYLSRAAVQRVIGDGLVKVNGRVVRASYHPRDGDVVQMVAPPKPISELVPEPIPLDIIYEDEHFLALNKQADLIVHPARGRWTGTLVNGLVYYGIQTGINFSSGGVRPENLPPPTPGKPAAANTGNWRPGILHRLDRNTTGIMLVAKSEEAHWRIARQFENRTIQKTYVALCHGIPQLSSDVLNLPIGKDRYIREKQAVRKEENGGKPATTLYEVQETFSHNSSPHSAIRNPQSAIAPPPTTHPNDKPPPSPSNVSLIKLTPKTGRTHQLRVHMSAIGHPMVGDTMYGGHVFESDNFRFERQALHAYEITFTHPGTLKPMTLQAPLPPDITRLTQILRSTNI
jgi:23S rRNA pseudouridine1911/1915/1917 synthase